MQPVDQPFDHGLRFPELRRWYLANMRKWSPARQREHLGKLDKLRAKRGLPPYHRGEHAHA